MNQHANDDKADHSQYELRGGYRTQIHQRGFTSDNHTGTLEANDSDEEPDTGGDAVFQVPRNIVNQFLTEVGQGQYNEDDTFYQYCCQSDLPWICDSGFRHWDAHGICKVCVQTHSGSQRNRIVGKECHE